MRTTISKILIPNSGFFTRTFMIKKMQFCIKALLASASRALFLYIIYIIIPWRNDCFGQVESPHYAISFYGGWLHSISDRGPRETTEVSEVKFVRPVTKNLGLGFDISLSESYSLGIIVSLNEFDYGYRASPHYNSSKLTSGLEAANDRVILYCAGIRGIYKLINWKKFRINAVITPCIGYYPYSGQLADTTDNEVYRTKPMIRDNEVHYMRYPPYQKEGIAFYLRGGFEGSFFIKQHFVITAALHYQQGFNPFVIDTVNIVRPYEPTGEKQAKYWTKVNGTSLQFQLGIGYRF